MQLTTLIYEVAEPIAHITLNRPNVLNAINNAMERELIQAFDAAEADPRVRVVLLSGAGRAFSAGYDLKETATNPVKGTVAWQRRLSAHLRQMLRIWELEKPVVAAVHGFALGGGCDLALICDLTVAGAGAYFGEPEARFGSGVVTMVMPWLMGMKKTRELLYLGHDRISAAEAEGLGLVNRVVPDEQLLAEARQLALEIARVDPEVVRLTKLSINRTYEIAGFLSALKANVDIATVIETSDTPDRREFDRLRAEKGLKAALEWRDNRFRS